MNTDVALATARAGNVIGGGDWSEDRLIPDLIRGFVSGQPVLIRRPKAIRPWQHVLESLHGYLMLAAGTPRAGCEVRFRLQLRTERRGHMAGRAHCDQARATCGATARPGFAIRFPACTRIIFSGWTPARPASNSDGNQGSESKTALEWTMAWYRAWNQGEDMAEFTGKQILEYEELCAR